MNAKEALRWMEHDTGIMSCNDEAWPIAIRALRLLAAAEANDGTPAEVLPNFIAEQLCSDYIRGKCGDPNYDDCSCQRLVRGYEQINNERNGLAARVAELERAVDLAARAMAGEGVEDQGQAWDRCLRILDAERSKP